MQRSQTRARGNESMVLQTRTFPSPSHLAGLENCCRMYELGVAAAISSAFATAPFMPAELIRKRQPEVKQEGHSAPANTLGSAAKGQLQHQQRSSDPKKQVRPWQGRSAPAAEHSLPILPARKRRCALMPAAFERTLSGVGQHQLSAKRAQQHTALQRPAGQHTGLCNVGARLPFAEIGLLTRQPPGAAGREPD